MRESRCEESRHGSDFGGREPPGRCNSGLPFSLHLSPSVDAVFTRTTFADWRWTGNSARGVVVVPILKQLTAGLLKVVGTGAAGPLWH